MFASDAVSPGQGVPDIQPIAGPHDAWMVLKYVPIAFGQRDIVNLGNRVGMKMMRRNN